MDQLWRKLKKQSSTVLSLPLFFFQTRKLQAVENEEQQSQIQPRGRSSSRRSGYVNSGAETEAAETAVAAARRTRRRQRSRSRSPGSEARSRPMPAELMRHLEFGLVEPTKEGLRGEIPFTNVETAAAARPARVGGGGGRVGGSLVDERTRHARRM